FAWRFGDVAAIWGERNLLLRDTVWPRRAHLAFEGFPENGDLRVGKDAPPPKVKVRAFKWVIADRGKDHPHGWRPLMWGDLTHKNLLGSSVPAPAVGAESWDADRVEAAVGDRPE